MNAHRFDLLVTWVLLLFAAWYTLEMSSYSGSAGRVPAICSAVMAAALVVQLVSSHRRRTMDAVASEPAIEPSVVGPTPSHVSAEVDPEVGHYEPEPDSYETLIALHGVRRRRFLAIAVFSCAFYVGFVLVGFVVSTAVLITAILLAARERPYVALIGGAVGGAAAYALVVALLNMPPLHGLLFP